MIEEAGHFALWEAEFIVADAEASALATISVGGSQGSGTLAVGQLQPARPGGGSSLVAYAAIVATAVVSTWQMARTATYNRSALVAASQLLHWQEETGKPNLPQAIQPGTRTRRPGDCEPDVDYLIGRASTLQARQVALTGSFDSDFTTAVLRASSYATPWVCFDYVGSGKRFQFGYGKASPVLGELMPNEIPVRLAGQHAEIVTLTHAVLDARVPNAMGVSRKSCDSDWGCEAALLMTGAVRRNGGQGWLWLEAVAYEVLPW